MKFLDSTNVVSVATLTLENKVSNLIDLFHNAFRPCEFMR